MPADPLPPELVGELERAFRRLEPRGSAPWALSSNLDRLRRALGRGVRLDDPDPADVDPPAPSAAPTAGALRPRLRGALRTGAEQVAGPGASRRARMAARQVVERSTAGLLGVLEESLDAVAESLRFLSARVESLEAAAAGRRRPLDGLAFLVDPPELGPWAGTIAEWLGPAPGAGGTGGPAGEVLVAECGDGALPEALAGLGWRVRAAEPRAPAALAAARRGVRVSVQDAPAALADVAPGTLRAVVLAGVVDRAPVDEVVATAEAAVGRLVVGGTLAVVCRSDAGWGEAARDLLPGRPLGAGTWGLVLGRAGLVGVVSAARDDGWAVAGRR